MSIISIIGTGNMARTIGALAVAGGNTVEVMGRDQSKAADLAKALGGSATTGEWGAVPAGDIVIVALLYASVVPVVAQYGDALAGKVIVDISNPFNAAADGLAIPRGHLDRAGSRQGGPGQRQRGEGVQHHLPACPGEGPATRRLHRRRRRAGQGGRRTFIESLGLRPLDVGGLKMAHWLEGAGLVMMGLARHGVGNWDFALGVTELPG